MRLHRQIAMITIAFTLLSSCLPKSPEWTAPQPTKEELDSFSRSKYGMSAEDRIKEMTNNSLSRALMDTAGLYKSPIKVLKSSFIKREYGNYRDVSITFKNIGTKRIAGVKFMWKALDAFKKPAEAGGSVDGFGSGFTDEEIKPGSTLTVEWNVSSKNGKTIVLAWPFEVAYADGTSWKLK